MLKDRLERLLSQRAECRRIPFIWISGGGGTIGTGGRGGDSGGRSQIRPVTWWLW